MIEGSQYIEVINEYFDFLITEFALKASREKVRGNAFYDVQYRDLKKVVSISYENIEDYLLVIVFMLQNGELPDYDDKTKTLHLNQLNAKVISQVGKKEINGNNEFFFKFKASDEVERKLLKSAKELRLCLKHLGDLFG